MPTSQAVPSTDEEKPKENQDTSNPPKLLQEPMVPVSQAVASTEDETKEEIQNSNPTLVQEKQAGTVSPKEKKTTETNRNESAPVKSKKVYARHCDNKRQQKTVAKN